MRKSGRLSTTLALLALAVAAVIYFYRSRPGPEPVPGPVSGKLVIHFLDIGQGDCELIQLPGGETVLIDSGDRGAPTVDLLKKYGVKNIDLIIASHPHADHIGEMRDVMRAFTVKEFWDSGFPHPTKTYADMLQEIKSRGISFSTPKRGATRQFGQVLLEVLNPGPQPPDDNPNNSSVVVRLTFGGKRFLFTGDAEIPESASKQSAWQQMLTGDKEKLRADLLKAAHHGSHNGTTAEILNAVRPSIYAISCGIGNDYNHPHAEVVQMLEERKNEIEVYRTDLQGTITAVCDGNGIEMSVEKEAGQDRLYLTGNEASGKTASDTRQQNNSSGRQSGRRSR